MNPDSPNVLHSVSEKASWSRANEKGVFPGIATPLNWSIWGGIGERSVRWAAYSLGVFDRKELDPPARVDERSWSIFYGRPTANVDTWRRIHVGFTADEGAQHHVFGEATSDALVDAKPDRRERIAAQRAKMLPLAAEGMARERRNIGQWWAESLQTPIPWEADRARAILSAGLERFERADRFHILVSLLSMEAMTDLARVAERAGLADLPNEMMVGYPGMEEFETTAMLWAVSRGEETFDSFLNTHGFHGSQEGEIASASWREDPRPVRDLVDRYAALGKEEAPLIREERSIQRRAELELQLRKRTPAPERADLDEIFERAATFLPLREAGRASLTIALDAMRGAARSLGATLVQEGRIGHESEVFLATAEELLDPPKNLLDRLEERKRLREIYASFDLPETWIGMPEKIPTADAEQAALEDRASSLTPGENLEGLGASSGQYVGTARVVLDPNALSDDFENGDVLVAPSTDPSWAPLFLIAGAVVIDTGSNFSHAAIVAREMGIPAVVAAPGASQRIPDGARICVDGKTGTVAILE